MPASLKEVLAAADPVKKRQVLQSLSQHLIPIMEKGLVDSQLSHRCTLCPWPQLHLDKAAEFSCDTCRGSHRTYMRVTGHWWDLHAD